MLFAPKNGNEPVESRVVAMNLHSYIPPGVSDFCAAMACETPSNTVSFGFLRFLLHLRKSRTALTVTRKCRQRDSVIDEFNSDGTGQRNMIGPHDNRSRMDPKHRAALHPSLVACRSR